MYNFEIQQSNYNVGHQHLSSRKCWQSTNTRTVSKKLGEQIRIVRKKKPLTLKALGEKIGYSHSYLSQVENGIYEPEKSLLILLAKELNDNFGLEWLGKYLVENEPSVDEKFELLSLKFGGLKGNKKLQAEVLIDVLERELERLANEN